MKILHILSVAALLINKGVSLEISCLKTSIPAQNLKKDIWEQNILSKLDKFYENECSHVSIKLNFRYIRLHTIIYDIRYKGETIFQISSSKPEDLSSVKYPVFIKEIQELLQTYTSIPFFYNTHNTEIKFESIWEVLHNPQTPRIFISTSKTCFQFIKESQKLLKGGGGILFYSSKCELNAYKILKDIDDWYLSVLEIFFKKNPYARFKDSYNHFSDEEYKTSNSLLNQFSSDKPALHSQELMQYKLFPLKS